MNIVFKLALILLLIPFESFSWQIQTSWNNSSFEKDFIVTCSHNESHLCLELCEDERVCSLTEDYCRDCAGNNIYLLDLFNDMGSKYNNSSIGVADLEFFRYLKKNKWQMLDSKSIYNFVDSYNSLKVKTKFQKLCDFNDQYPMVFLDLKPISNELGAVKYVVCQSSMMEESSVHAKVFIMNSKPKIIINR